MTATTASSRVLVDSAGWVEYFADGPKAEAFDPYLVRQNDLVIPTIVLYEVSKKLLATRGEAAVDRFLSAAFRSEIVDLDTHIALAAAENSLKHKLAMADAIIYTTAQSYQAELVTSDQAFQGLQRVTLL